MLEPPQIAPTQPTSPNAPTSDLHPTVVAIMQTLTKSLDADDVAVSKLRSRRVALAHVEVFAQVLAQVPVSASGADFVAGASWLSGYYWKVAAATSEAVRSVSVLRPDGQLLSGGAAEQHRRMLGELEGKASMWDEVVEAAMVRSMIATPNSPSQEAAVVVASPLGTLRIWTAVAAAAVAQAPKQRGPAEARAVYDMASTLSSEAAAMAAGLLGG